MARTEMARISLLNTRGLRMNRLNRWSTIVALTAVSALAVAAAQNAGGPPSPEAQAKSAIETRQGLFKVMGSQMGPIGAMLRNQREFDAALVARNAARIQMLSEIVPELFTLDTRQFKTVKSAALDGIWNSQADFKGKADNLNKAATALVAASKTGDKGSTLKAAGEVGKACGGCHDNYRAKP
jgi:cytochrome c556